MIFFWNDRVRSTNMVNICRGTGFIMDPAVQMDPPYFSIKEAINQIQNNMVLSQSQTERKTKIENENI